MRRVVEQLAFLAREDKRVDKRSGVSQRLPISVLENIVSNAERRALKAKDDMAVPRVTDLYSAMPAITGKLELEYEGELKGGDTVARELIRASVGKIFNESFEGVNFANIIQWFDLGGTLKLDEGVSSANMVQQLAGIQGLMEKTKGLNLSSNEPDAVRAAAAEFILEGLYAHRRIGRSEERGFSAEEKPARREQESRPERPNLRRPLN
jgi:magnesium chelatase subunit I